MRFLLTATFGILLARYLLIDLAMINLEGYRWIFPAYTFNLTEGAEVTAVGLIDTLPAMFLAVQIGLLTIISLALALVTLIAQRDDATTDIKVYYHESMFFGMAASGIALVLVLVAQLFWPLQTLYRHLAGSSPSAVFDFLLTTAHAIWLVVNLCGVAHFVAVTFDFVQPSSRKRLRERYTANAVVPHQLAEVFRRQLYLQAEGVSSGTDVRAAFGLLFRPRGDEQLRRDFGEGEMLADVHMRLVRWVLRHWQERCELNRDSEATDGNFPPKLTFIPVPGRILSGSEAWCVREGGVPLTSLERWLLKLAFRFERIERGS